PPNPPELRLPPELPRLMLDEPRFTLLRESLRLKPPNPPRLDALLPRLRLPIRSLPPKLPPRLLKPPLVPTPPRLETPPRLPKLVLPTPPGRVVLPRLPPCRPIWFRAPCCRLAKESPLLLPPNLSAVARSL